MTVVLGCLLLVAAIVGARALVPRTMVDPSGRRLAGATLFFALFAGAFLVQGFAELVTGTPAIGIARASVLVVAIALVAIVARRRTGPAGVAPVASQSAANGRFRTIPAALARLSIAVVVLLVVLLAAGLPRGYEVHAYHLPIAVRIFRDGTLTLWDHAFMHAYPALMSVWAGFFLTVLPERWTALADLPVFALMLGALYALSRRAGADRSASLLVVLGLATIPIFGFSALEIGADIGGVAFTLVAAWFVMVRPEPSNSATTTTAALAGIAAGLAFGFKSLDIIPITLFGLFVIVQCAADWRERRTLAAFLPVIVYAACGLGTMSFWLVRNLVEVDNPLYPVHIKGVFDWFGWKPAPGFTLASRIENEQEWVARSSDWFTYPWIEHHFINQNFKHSSGLGPFFAMTVPVALVLWPVRAFAARRAFGPALRIQAMLYATAVVVLLAWWKLGDRQPRYVMVAIALLLPIVAVGITAARGRMRNAYEALLAIGVATMLIVLLVRVGVENGALLLGQRGASRWQLMQYPHAIDALPAGAVIANAHEREDSYALLGDGLRNHVVDASLVGSTFEQRDHALRLTAKGVQELGLTHLYRVEDQPITTDDCVTLREVARLDRNPFNGLPVSPARVLDAIDVCPASAPGADPARGG